MDSSSQKILEQYLRLVCDCNKTLNLTNVVDFQDGCVLHIEDSLAALPEVEAAPDGSYADLGTGGGFPGVPLAVATGRPTLLVDSTAKKIDAVCRMVRELGLTHVDGYAGRIEDLAHDRPTSFAVVTARALAPLPSLLELASPLLFIGGRFVAYKGNNYQEELVHALRIQEKLGLQHVHSRDFVLSDGTTKRSLHVFEKVSEPEVALPRRVGVAQKRPYK